MVSTYQAEDLKRFISPVGHIEFDYESYYQTFDRINEAINAGKKVSFLYFKYDVRKEPILYNDGKPCIFSPHRLIWNGSCFYMIGVLEYGKGIETFRIDRILNLPLIMEEDAFPLPEGFNLDEHLQNEYWMHGTDNTTVELICTNDLMDVILDEFGKDVTTYAYEYGELTC